MMKCILHALGTALLLREFEEDFTAKEIIQGFAYGFAGVLLFFVYIEMVAFAGVFRF